MDISTVSDNLKKIKRGWWLTFQIMHCTCITVDKTVLLISDDSEALIDSAKTAASASFYTVGNITERLRNTSQELERITFSNVSVNIDDILNNADQAGKYLKVENTYRNKIKHYLFRVFILFH